MDAGFDGARGSVSVFFAQLFFSLLVFGSLFLSFSLLYSISYLQVTLQQEQQQQTLE